MREPFRPRVVLTLHAESAIGVLYARKTLACGHDTVTSGDGRHGGLQRILVIVGGWTA
jgi:hypothetical protein